MTLDDGEDVVEIMRHPGSELADALHLLRLPQLGFEIQTLGVVVYHEQQAARGIDLDQFGGDERIACLTFFGAELALRIPHGLALYKLFDDVVPVLDGYP